MKVVSSQGGETMDVEHAKRDQINSAYATTASPASASEERLARGLDIFNIQPKGAKILKDLKLRQEKVAEPKHSVGASSAGRLESLDTFSKVTVLPPAVIAPPSRLQGKSPVARGTAVGQQQGVGSSPAHASKQNGSQSPAKGKRGTGTKAGLNMAVQQTSSGKHADATISDNSTPAKAKKNFAPPSSTEILKGRFESWVSSINEASSRMSKYGGGMDATASSPFKLPNNISDMASRASAVLNNHENVACTFESSEGGPSNVPSHDGGQKSKRKPKQAFHNNRPRLSATSGSFFGLQKVNSSATTAQGQIRAVAQVIEEDYPEEAAQKAFGGIQWMKQSENSGITPFEEEMRLETPFNWKKNSTDGEEEPPSYGNIAEALGSVILQSSEYGLLDESSEEYLAPYKKNVRMSSNADQSSKVFLRMTEGEEDDSAFAQDLGRTLLESRQDPTHIHRKKTEIPDEGNDISAWYVNQCVSQGIMPLRSVATQPSNPVINAKHCALRPRDFEVLSGALVRLDSLVELDLRDNRLEGLQTMLLIGDLITLHESLKSIILSRNKFSLRDASILAASIACKDGEQWKQVRLRLTSEHERKFPSLNHRHKAKEVLSSDWVFMPDLFSSSEIEDAEEIQPVSVMLPDQMEDHGVVKLGLEQCFDRKESSAALIILSASLLFNRRIQTLNLASNHAEDELGLVLAEVIRQNATIRMLNIDWNCINGQGARAVCQSLGSNTSLTDFSMAWNGLNDLDSLSAIADVFKSRNPPSSIQRLNLASNRIDSRGAAILAEGFAHSCVDLVYVDMSNNSIGLKGARSLHRSVIDASSGEDSRLQIDMDGCNLSFVDPHSFDPTEPAGSYILDCSEPYTQVVLQNMCKLVKMKRGEFVAASVRLNGSPFTINAQQSSPSLPTSGELSFEFVELVVPFDPNAPLAAPQVISSIVETIKSSASGDNFHLMADVVSGGHYFSSQQVAGMLQTLSDSCGHGRSSSQAKLSLATRLFTKVVDRTRILKAFGALNNAEQKKFERDIGKEALHFSPSFAHGPFKLDLSRVSDRDVALYLMKQRKDIEVSLDSSMPAKCIETIALPLKLGLQASTTKFDALWRVCTFKGKSVDWREVFPIPRSGKLTLRIVDPYPISEGCVEVSSWDLREFIDKTILELEDKSATLENLVLLIREHIQDKCFSVQQIKEMFNQLPSKPTLLKVELACLLFRRVVDWHSLSPLFGSLSYAEIDYAKQCLGRLALFDELHATGFYRLDLRDPVERCMMQTIVTLAVNETGVNYCQTYYNGLRFEIPSSWAVEVPHRGVCTFFYCRSREVVQDLVRQAPSSSISDELMLVCGTEWVIDVRMWSVVRAMAKVFDRETLFEEFSKFDKDGSGDISQGELASWLREAGVICDIDDMRFFFQHLDDDGSGKLEFSEMLGAFEQYEGKECPIDKLGKPLASSFAGKGAVKVQKSSDGSWTLCDMAPIEAGVKVSGSEAEEHPVSSAGGEESKTLPVDEAA